MQSNLSSKQEDEPKHFASRQDNANYAIPKYLLLFFVQNNPAITISSLLIAHVSTTTATTNVTMTQVPATKSATTNVPKYQLDKCKAT
jgi:hypothetical protein